MRKSLTSTTTHVLIVVIISIVVNQGFWFSRNIYSDDIYGFIGLNSDALIFTTLTENSGTATVMIVSLRFGIGALARPIFSLCYEAQAQLIFNLSIVFNQFTFVCLSSNSTRIITQGLFNNYSKEIEILVPCSFESNKDQFWCSHNRFTIDKPKP